LPHSQSIRGQGTNRHPLQSNHFVPQGGNHAANLPVPAGEQGDFISVTVFTPADQRHLCGLQ
jgi:hypothetical protein